MPRNPRNTTVVGKQAVAVSPPNGDIGRIPPHLLPDRGGSNVVQKTASRVMVEKAGVKQCPYGWHAASPERQRDATPPPPPRVVAPPTPGLNQESEVGLMKQQLAMALEQVRGLRDENRGLKVLSPRKVQLSSPGQPLDQFLSNIDEVISHHDRISSRTLDYSRLAEDEVMSPKERTIRPELTDLQLKQANNTISEQRDRITDLEQRLAQREEHIDKLTRSLIDLGQHNSKLQIQIRGLVNDLPARQRELEEVPVPAERAFEAIESHQSKVRRLDEEVKEQFEAVKEAAVGDGAEDFKKVLEAIEEHRERADQITSLNKQSMGMLKGYYLDAGAKGPWEELADKLLETGEWVKRHDESLNKTYYYNPSENRVSWDLVEDLQKARSVSPEAPPPPPATIPIPTYPTAYLDKDKSQSPRRAAAAILTATRDMSPYPSLQHAVPIPSPTYHGTG